MPKRLNDRNERNPMVVELAENISVMTIISKENHAALRAGFAGYPANPRWNVSKFSAWKTGKQWREALECGKMSVSPIDSMLISSEEQKPATNHPEISSKSEIFNFSVLGKQLLSYYHKGKSHLPI